MDPFDITRGYQENIGSKPLRDIPTLSLGAGLATYMAGKPLLSAISNLAATSGNPLLQTAVTKYLAPGGDVETGRRRLAMLATAAGAIYGIYKHADWMNGWDGLSKSLTTDDYWKNHPEAAAKYTPAMPLSPEASAVSMDKQAAWGMQNSFSNAFEIPNIPIGRSINYLQQDPYLLHYNKKKVGDLLVDSSSNAFTSQASLMNTALKTGVDFGAAYLFSTGVGKLLAMPEPMVKRISALGGLSAAVVSSGILKQL